MFTILQLVKDDFNPIREFVLVRSQTRRGQFIIIAFNIKPTDLYEHTNPPDAKLIASSLRQICSEYGEFRVRFSGTLEPHRLVGSAHMNHLGLRLEHRMRTALYMKDKQVSFEQGFWVPIAK